MTAVPTPKVAPAPAPPPAAKPAPAVPAPIVSKASPSAVARQPSTHMDLGTIKDDAGRLYDMIRRRRWYVIKAVKDGNAPIEDVYKYDLMFYETYLETLRNRKSLYAELLKQTAASLPAFHPDYAPHHAQVFIPPGQWTFLLQPASTSYTPDEKGWISYLRDQHPRGVEETLKEPDRKALYAEAGRQEHSLIVAPSNWGKSELIKALLYHYTQDRSAAVVVLDPGGDLVKQVRKWPELVRENRLCLIQPGLDENDKEGGSIGKGLTVGFNPLDGTGLDAEERRVIAADWAHTLGMIGAKEHDLSPNMILLVTMCVQVLLTVPDATLDDLGHLLMLRPPRKRGETERAEAQHPRAAELQRLARDYEVARVANFFRHDYDTDAVEGTRAALRRRMETVLNYPHAEALLTGRATISLEQEIEARRFILVDLSRFKKTGGTAIGRLFMAQVAAIGRRRESQPKADRTPTHIFVDEASTMVSASMFEITREMRKFGIFLTLAQQVGGDEMTPEQKARLKIVGCKMIAPSDMAAEWIKAGPHNSIPHVDQHEFVVQWAGCPDIKRLKIRSDLADDKHRVSPVEWREHLQAITGEGGYYRPAGLVKTVPLVNEPGGDLGNQVETSIRANRRAAVPEDVPPELADRFTSTKGRKGNW